WTAASRGQSIGRASLTLLCATARWEWRTFSIELIRMMATKLTGTRRVCGLNMDWQCDSLEKELAVFSPGNRKNNPTGIRILPSCQAALESHSLCYPRYTLSSLSGTVFCFCQAALKLEQPSVSRSMLWKSHNKKITVSKILCRLAFSSCELRCCQWRNSSAGRGG